jgi:hypothetical protein
MSQQPEEFSNLIPLGPNQPEHAQDEIISQEGINGLNRNDPNRSMVILNNIDGKKTEGKTESKNERPDNLRRTAFIILMVHLKILFADLFGLDFDSFKCNEVLGNYIRHFKRVLNLKIYQILCCRYPENAVKLIKFATQKMQKSKKLMFYYFMTRTYEELYKRYISGNIDFPILPNGTVRICKFMTLKKAIAIKDKNGNNKIKNIEEFVKVSQNMFNDIETKGKTKEEYVDKPLITFEFDIFDRMRDHFDEDAIPSEIQLEE